MFGIIYNSRNGGINQESRKIGSCSILVEAACVSPAVGGGRKFQQLFQSMTQNRDKCHYRK